MADEEPKQDTENQAEAAVDAEPGAAEPEAAEGGDAAAAAPEGGGEEVQQETETAPSQEAAGDAEAGGEAEVAPAADGGDGEAAPPAEEAEHSAEEEKPAEEGGEQPAGTPAAEGEPQPAGEEGGEAAAGDADGGEQPEGGEGETVKPEGEDGEGKGEAAAEGEGEGQKGEGEEEEAKPEGEGEEAAKKPEGEADAEEKGERLAEGEGEAGEGDDKPAGEEGEVKEGEEAQETAEGAEAKEEAEGDGEKKEDGDTKDDEEKDGEKTPVPQSDTFAEGEVQEGSKLTIGEPLSREGSPEGDKAGEGEVPPETAETPPVPGTPDRELREEDEDLYMEQEEEEEYEEEEEEEEEEEPEYNRDELLERYHQALAEREQLQAQNFQLQHKLGDYFRKKKQEDVRQEVEKNATDQEHRYLKYMKTLDDLRMQDADEREHNKATVDEMLKRSNEKKEQVEQEAVAFLDFKEKTALASANGRSGKPIPPKDVKQLLSVESKKEQEVIDVRLEHIKLKNKLKKKEQQRKSKEELAEGLHLIDFEQLKIENQTYNEKIEERNEEILKLRKKINANVQVLTHFKEKLQFVQADNQQLRTQLRDVEEQAARKRDIISRTKQARDALRIDNQRLRQNCGLLGNEPLLRDFEERKDEVEELMEKLERLKMHHAELTLTCNGVRRKIDQAQSLRS